MIIAMMLQKGLSLGLRGGNRIWLEYVKKKKCNFQSKSLCEDSKHVEETN